LGLPSSLDFGASHEQDVASNAKYLYEQNCRFILTNVHENIFLQQGRGAFGMLSLPNKVTSAPKLNYETIEISGHFVNL